MIVAVCAALGMGVLWGVLIVSLCQAARRGDEVAEAVVAADERDTARWN
jgi:hypothetical protein